MVRKLLKFIVKRATVFQPCISMFVYLFVCLSICLCVCQKHCLIPKIFVAKFESNQISTGCFMKSSCFQIHLIWIKGEGKMGKNYTNYSLFYPVELIKYGIFSMIWI